MAYAIVDPPSAAGGYPAAVPGEKYREDEATRDRKARGRPVAAEDKAPLAAAGEEGAY